MSWEQGDFMHSFASVAPHRIASQSSAHPISSLSLSVAAACRAVSARCVVLTMGSLFYCLAALGQTPAPAAPVATSPSAAQQPAVLAPQLPRVTTTVVVKAWTGSDYLPESVTVGNLESVPLKEMPLSATVVTRELLNDQGARLLSDVVKNDASVSDDYVPVGYYGDYEIRGFPIDLATGLEINGMTIAGEQDVPLENKQSVEFLKGIAGVESGVASAGGLIDFVTKRPATIKVVDLATDQRGTTYGGVDLGTLLGRQKQVGVRVNLAAERIQTYMNDTNGWRAVGAGAADWHISPKAILKGDFEYQHKTERDGSGYQLLGGTTVPNINKIYPSTMLGDQSWSPPDTYDTFNTSTRLDYDLPAGWHAFAEGSFSHSLIQDNVIYAYGTPFDENGNVACPGAPGAPEFFFCPAVPSIDSSGGDYGIYDYRDPGELRIDAEAEALLTGHIKTGAITQDVAFGGELFLRSVQQPGFYTFANPSSPDGAIQDGAVYAYVGAENIYQPLVPLPIESPLESAGPRRLWEDSHQSAVILQDRVRLPGRIQLIAGGRYDSLRDHNYSVAATSPCTPAPNNAPGPANDPCPTSYDSLNNAVDSIPTLPSNTDKPVWLPQYAVTFNPVENLTLYGNYGVMLSLGPQAPWWVENANQFLGPFFTRQAEIGAKYEPDQRILLTTAFFHMRAPFLYPDNLGVGANCFGNTTTSDTPFCFVSEGRETHDGIELNAEGQATSWLRLTASAAAIRALSSDTGTPSYDNKQVLNVPHLHTTVFADWTLPRLRGLHLMPGWSYTGRKEATRDDATSVPGYNLFNLGARYTPGGEKGRVTFRIYADNITDKRYWSDTGASYGDTFIWLGAPTTVRLSAHYTF
jgi:iron complex outermembrane receptor protein